MAGAPWRLLSPRIDVSFAAESETRTVLLTLGVGASSVEPWDGSVEVSGGELVEVEGRHFSSADAVIEPNSWRVSNRRGGVAGRQPR